MIDQTIKEQLILCREILAGPQPSPGSSRAQRLQDLIICHGVAKTVLAAICIQLDCVPDKKQIGLQDYFFSLARFSSPVLPLAGGEFIAALEGARCETELGLHLPAANYWTDIRETTLKSVSEWCRLTLNVELRELAHGSSAAAHELSSGPPHRGPAHKLDSGAVPASARYACGGSVDIRLSRWGRSEKGTIANLSLGGCSIRSHFTFEVEEKIEMILEVNGTCFRVAGKVVHASPPHLQTRGGTGIGVKFENMTAGALIRLKDLIKELDAKAMRRQNHQSSLLPPHAGRPTEEANLASAIIAEGLADRPPFLK